MLDKTLTVVAYLGAQYIVMLAFAEYNRITIWSVIGAIIAYRVMDRLFWAAVFSGKEKA